MVSLTMNQFQWLSSTGPVSGEGVDGSHGFNSAEKEAVPINKIDKLLFTLGSVYSKKLVAPSKHQK